MLGVSPGSLVDSLANMAQIRNGRSGKSPVRHFDVKLIAKALVFMSTEMEDVTDEWSHVSVLVSHAVFSGVFVFVFLYVCLSVGFSHDISKIAAARIT